MAENQIKYNEEYINERRGELRSEIAKENVMEDLYALFVALENVGLSASRERGDHREALEAIKRENKRQVEALQQLMKTGGYTPYQESILMDKIKAIKMTPEQMDEQARRIAAQKAADRRTYGE